MRVSKECSASQDGGSRRRYVAAVVQAGREAPAIVTRSQDAVAMNQGRRTEMPNGRG